MLAPAGCDPPLPHGSIQPGLTRPRGGAHIGGFVHQLGTYGPPLRLQPLSAFSFNKTAAPGKLAEDVSSLAEIRRPTRGFDGLIGIEPIREKLRLLVDCLQNPANYIRLGASLPRGVLLCGAPGTGKTRAAEAIAAEAGVPLIFLPALHLKPLERFEVLPELRRVFAQAAEVAKDSPCVLLLDGVAALGDSVICAMQTELAKQLDNVLLVATTCRFPINDTAGRSGPFAWLIQFSLPNGQGRADILQHQLKERPGGKAVDCRALAQIAVNYSGADIEHWVNDAALLAGSDRCETITEIHLREALRTQLHGTRVDLKSSIDLGHTACHEAGHVLVAHALGFDVGEASISSRDCAEGYTQLQDVDTYPLTAERERAHICVLMAGMAAEKLYGLRVAGSSHDLAQARLCVAFLHEEGLNDSLSADIDDSFVCHILAVEEARASKILRRHPAHHKALTQALVDKRDLDAGTIARILAGMSMETGVWVGIANARLMGECHELATFSATCTGGMPLAQEVGAAAFARHLQQGATQLSPQAAARLHEFLWESEEGRLSCRNLDALMQLEPHDSSITRLVEKCATQMGAALGRAWVAIKRGEGQCVDPRMTWSQEDRELRQGIDSLIVLGGMAQSKTVSRLLGAALRQAFAKAQVSMAVTIRGHVPLHEAPRAMLQPMELHRLAYAGETVLVVDAGASAFKCELVRVMPPPDSNAADPTRLTRIGACKRMRDLQLNPLPNSDGAPSAVADDDAYTDTMRMFADCLEWAFSTSEQLRLQPPQNVLVGWCGRVAPDGTVLEADRYPGMLTHGDSLAADLELLYVATQADFAHDADVTPRLQLQVTNDAFLATAGLLGCHARQLRGQLAVITLGGEPGFVHVGLNAAAPHP